MSDVRYDDPKDEQPGRFVLGPERIAQLALQRREVIAPTGTWGVWDLHWREWLTVGHSNERDAWLALLDLASDRPWDLRIARPDEDNRPILSEETQPSRKKPETVTCERCQGSGDCPTCGFGDCPDCDGRGKVPA